MRSAFGATFSPTPHGGSGVQSHLVAWVLPTLVMLAMVGLYFSGSAELQSLVAPEFNRELGVLETLQHGILLVALAIAARGSWKARTWVERLFFVAILLGVALLLLEEINYGQHYWDALRGISKRETSEVWNLHNRNNWSSAIKKLADAAILLGFVVLPLLVTRRSPAWLRYLAPPRLLILTVISSVLVTKLAHYLSGLDYLDAHPLEKSNSEFREAYIYYVGLLYLYALVFERVWPEKRRRAA